MNKKQIADYLQQYNNWRRDKNCPPVYPTPNPIKLGKVIDMAIKELRK